MASMKPPESESASRQGSIPEHASDWFRQFSTLVEDYFISATQSLSSDAGFQDYCHVTVRAMVRTLLDSGADEELLAGEVGQALLEERFGSTEWNSKLNQRRFELIDREFEQTLTPAEKVELAGLTSIMRKETDSESNLPTEGAKALHRRLQQSATKGKPS